MDDNVTQLMAFDFSSAAYDTVLMWLYSQRSSLFSWYQCMRSPDCYFWVYINCKINFVSLVHAAGLAIGLIVLVVSVIASTLLFLLVCCRWV